MRNRIADSCETYTSDEDLGPLLDLNFIQLVALLVVLAFFLSKELDNRFAVPYGKGAGIVELDEQEYSRMVTVSLGGNGELTVNGNPVTGDTLVEEVGRLIAIQGDEANNQVVYDADPTIPHGEAEDVHLLLLRKGFAVLKEYRGDRR